MKNVDKLTDTLIHIEHVLEKNIPKGYHEIVQEYVNQNIVKAAVSIIGLIVVVILTVFIVKKYFSLSQKARDNYETEIMVYIVVAVFICGFCSSMLVGALEHVVAPNWFILQKLLSK